MKKSLFTPFAFNNGLSYPIQNRLRVYKYFRIKGKMCHISAFICTYGELLQTNKII